mmetsp:Transcript_72358/g.169443  ORF Transcript_72358/g.169443 Transcript_72358/m.169443 type:complete len:279 (-) Transcript_72358:46-882(-)
MQLNVHGSWSLCSKAGKLWRRTTAELSIASANTQNSTALPCARLPAAWNPEPIQLLYKARRLWWKASAVRGLLPASPDARLWAPRDCRSRLSGEASRLWNASPELRGLSSASSASGRKCKCPLPSARPAARVAPVELSVEATESSSGQRRHRHSAQCPRLGRGGVKACLCRCPSHAGALSEALHSAAVCGQVRSLARGSSKGGLLLGECLAVPGWPGLLPERPLPENAGTLSGAGAQGPPGLGPAILGLQRRRLRPPGRARGRRPHAQRRESPGEAVS